MKIIAFIIACFLCLHCHGYEATWDGAHLALTFGAGNDEVLLSVDGQGYLYLTENYGYPNQTAGRLVTNQGEINPASVATMTIDLGAGDDKFADPNIPPTEVFTLHGGTGTNFVNLPTPAALTYYYGGPDYDDIELDHSPLVVCYTGGGDGAINGNASGTTAWIDLEPGNNSTTGNFVANTYYVVHPGSEGAIVSYENNATYILLGGGTISSFVIYDDGGNDTLITQRSDVSGIWINGWPPEQTLALAGDYNGDNTVDARDYATLRKNNGDVFDQLLYRTGFGDTVAAARVVPEPREIALLSCLPILLLRRRFP